MKKKIKYTDEPMGEVREIKDFLPLPDKLVLRDEKVKKAKADSSASLGMTTIRSHKP